MKLKLRNSVQITSSQMVARSSLMMIIIIIRIIILIIIAVGWISLWPGVLPDLKLWNPTETCYLFEHLAIIMQYFDVIAFRDTFTQPELEL